jgi:hypothetical protein
MICFPIEGVDRGRRQAAVEVVDEDDELIDRERFEAAEDRPDLVWRRQPGRERMRLISRLLLSLPTLER